ncbi:MAG: hypothetical protein ACOYNN_06515 [Terrimicrobiaceae bacterium]|jgi:hypothetical protein
MKTILSLTTVVLLSASSLFAGDGKTFKDKVVVEPPTCLFRANEWQVDAFAAGLFSQSNRPGWGGGLGVNYFFNEYIGLGVEQSVVGTRGETSRWTTAGNFILRYPICSLNLAPYALIGGGTTYGQNRRGHGFGHIGGGLEYRVTSNIGLFSDARWLYSSEEPRSSVLGRAGVRFAF